MNDSTQNNLSQRCHKKLLVKLSLVLAFMIGFTFALVPLYDVLCSAFGINGKTADISLEKSLSYQVDADRKLDLRFLGTVSTGLPITFKPLVEEIGEVNTGKFYTINYEVKNMSDEVVVARAVPSVMPAQASLYFKKLYCFCFSDQTFQPKETRIMPLRFVVENEIPEKVKAIALSYTFYKAKTS